ncbi:MAG TPA: SEC-C metal-binding domain-containing protein [Planctomycetota bacterium]
MDVLRPLFTAEDRLTRDQVDEILRHGPALVPELVRLLEDEDAWEAEFPAGWAVVHAAYLLAALRPPGSLEVLVEAVDRAADYDEDWISEPAPFLLAAYGPSAVPLLRDVATDRDRAPAVRGAANEALSLIGRTHPEALDALRVSVDDRACDQDVRAFAALALLDFALPADRARIEAAADEDILTKEQIEETYQEGPPELPAPYDWMSFYSPDEIAARQEGDEEEPAAEEDVEEAPAEDAPPPPLKAAAVPGRNDPCPCGSRMKYKKCCGK